ncbi:hypothetical protein bpmyx0001_52940 [Bacillus pseudomycoides DSM 12442]|nr:hypothetical protein bpmyx0001_52940 [Bacillus pseudomycoides DSM 12442]
MIYEQVRLKKKRHPKVPFSDLNHLNFNNMYVDSHPLTILPYLSILFIEKKEKAP